MSVLVFTENWEGKFKKLTFELLSYASKLASMAGTDVVAVSIGNVGDQELQNLGKYGASKIINVNSDKLNILDNKVFTSIISQVAEKVDASVIILSHNNTGKALMPRLSARLRAGLVPGAVALPSSIEPFTILKKVFNGNAFSKIVVTTPKKIISLSQNSFEIIEDQKNASIENYSPEINDGELTLINKAVQTGKVLLTDAEIVVSGGRGMKGPENWKPIEELAELLGGATACSRPVSDEGWRSHHEHVGQTGKVIAPNLYFAFGISGAIQHIAGVSSSKFIVAVNKDPEAPVFAAADYGIVGDVMKVLPELIEGVKKLKASS